MYCIVDIETTGNGIIGNKITEIAIYKHDGQQIVDEFHSLVNPQCPIPYFITGLTGIDDRMVMDAPLFSELASSIQDFTADCIFIAHSVNFDYNVIKQEFKLLGQSFVRKKLCTVRLSRKQFPGLYSYSLGKLCAALGIPLRDRHRAGGDARATVRLFEKILASDNSEQVIATFLNARSQEATLPPGLAREVYEKLPTKPGIYFFRNKKGETIYVGKAKNIKKRILGHFYDKSTNEVRLCAETASIDFELSGSELVALLMESAAIRHHYPKFNRAQKNPIRQYGIFTYEDRNGIKHLAFNTLKHVPNPLLVLSNTTDCRLYLEALCMEFNLCPRYCHLQDTNGSCNHFRITTCKGICRGDEKKGTYNSRVEKAVTYMREQQQNIMIKEKGRSPFEEAIVLISEGVYKGFGFIPKKASLDSHEDLLAYVEPQKDTPEARRLIASYLGKQDATVLTTW